MRKSELVERLTLLQEGHDKAQDARRSVKKQLRVEHAKNHNLSLTLALAQNSIRRQRVHLTELIVERDRWREDADTELRALNKRLSEERDAAVAYAGELHAQLEELRRAAGLSIKDTPQ